MVVQNPYIGFRKDRRQTRDLWERFNSGTVVAESLPDRYQQLLIEEWMRCSALGIDPARRYGVRLDEEEVHAHADAARDFLDAARAAIGRAATGLAGVPGVLICADNSGVILHICGDKRVRVLAAERSGIVEGSCWSESVAGTNGLGTAIAKNQPVHVFASEHFCEGWQAWTCAATPVIRPGSKQICGVIDFTSVDRDYRDQALALASSIVASVESDLQINRQAKNEFLALRFHDAEARYPSDAIVAIESDGRPLCWSSGVSKAAIRALTGPGDCGRVLEKINVVMPHTGSGAGSLLVVKRSRASVRRNTPLAEITSTWRAESDVPGGEDDARPEPTGQHRGAALLSPGYDAGDVDTLTEYQQIFDNIIVGICYTRDRVISRCNRRFEAMFGYGPGELEDQSVRILYPSTESFEEIGRIGYKYLLTHQQYSDERLMLRKDGTVFWCNVSGKTLDPSRPQRGAIWIFQDISTRKQAEEALQRANERLEQHVQERTAELRRANDDLRAEVELRRVAERAMLVSREKYRAMFKAFPLGIAITDDQGEVIELNQVLGRLASPTLRATLGRGSDSPGTTVVSSAGKPILPEQLPSVRALNERRAFHDVELGVKYANGRIRWFSVSASPIPVDGYGVAVAHLEITERKRMEDHERQQRADLARVSRLSTMGEMAAALAHELGQPLSSMLNYLHGCQLRLAADDVDADMLRSGLSQAILHGERAGDILKHIRQFVRHHVPEKVPTDLNGLIREMVSFVDVEIRNCESHVRLSLPEGLPALEIDPLEIKQVVVNLLRNGLESGAEKPVARRTLEVSTQMVGRQWVEAAFADRGRGIHKKDSTRIFDAFFTTKRNGIGLGLAICRSIVESHGGLLTADSNVYGGATFAFRLPVRSSRQ
jgi:PAS domain S-box-containing protein